MRHSVAVLGAGASGLAAALRLAEHHDVLVLDESGVVGGKIASGPFRGRTIDVGPDSFLTRNPAAEELAKELGLGDDLIAPARSGASIFARGELRRLPLDLALGVPTSLRALLASQVLPARSVLRAGLDVVLPGVAISKAPVGSLLGSTLESDPSIGEVIGKRLGRGVLDALVAPLIAGINAGDIDNLSFAATAPELAAAIAGHRSIIKALRPLAGASRGPSGAQPGTRRAPFLGLSSGLSSLPKALSEALKNKGADIKLGAKVVQIERHGTSVRASGWTLEIEESSREGARHETIDVDALVLTVPAHACASLLRSFSQELAESCAGIEYSSVALLSAAWSSNAIPEIYGTGFLVPRDPDRITTALSNISAKWPHVSPSKETWLRVSTGYFGHNEPMSLSDDELIDRVLNELRELARIEDAPLDAMVTRWESAFPQYSPGHLARVAKIDALTNEIGTLALAGAAYHGIGIPACIADGYRASDQIVKALSS